MSNSVALLVSFPNLALKTECRFTFKLSATYESTSILGGNFIFGDEGFLLVADSYIKRKSTKSQEQQQKSYLNDRNNTSRDL